MKISIIGAGNVAWHLAQILYKNEHRIYQIVAKHLKSARKLSQLVKAEAIAGAENIKPDADIYILSIPDKALFSLAENEKLKAIIGNKPVVHTAGSIPANILKKLSNKYGVLYPLQTFSKQRQTDFSKIPLCIESPDTETLQILKQLAKNLSGQVRVMDSEQRKHLHTAAVFACNFTNRMYHAAQEILSIKNIDYDILKALVFETAEKSFEIPPKQAQTGPALRNDQISMGKHLELLKDFPDLRKIYSFVSNSIFQAHNKMDNFKERLKDIKAFVFDVDGVFSDLITLDAQGELLRSMNVKDGYALKFAAESGFTIGIITGGDSVSVKTRFERLGVSFIRLASHSKINDYNDFCKEYDIRPEQILYMGDDIPDYKPMQVSGLASCPADACEEIQEISHYISDKKGSSGCVRDVIEQVMRAQGKWFNPKKTG